MNETIGRGGVATAGRTPLHPIGVVASRTGLTPDVLRVWERRHRAVEPHRTETGQRLYTEADIERLRLLARATGKGRSIGQVVRLSESELRELVRGDDAATLTPRLARVSPPDAAAYVELAVEKAIRMDAAGLESLLRRLASLWGAPAFLESLAAPLLRRVGDEWHEGRVSVAQEHVASAATRSVLASLHGELAPPTAAPNLLVTTPANERHEIGAMLVAATAAAEGWRVTYLGPDLPAAETAQAALDTNARAVALSLVYAADADATVQEVAVLRKALPSHLDVLMGGRAALTLADRLGDAGARVLSGLEPLREWLRSPTA